MSMFDSGLIRKKGEIAVLTPERFAQLRVVRMSPYEVLRMEVLGYAVPATIYWLICRRGEGDYVRVPFARNRRWFVALTGEVELAFIAQLPQVYIT